MSPDDHTTLHQAEPRRSDDMQVLDDIPPLIKPGFYEVMLDGFETAVMYSGKANKLILTFRVVEFGPAFGEKIPRYYNVDRIIGRPQKGGRFKVSKKRDFTREFLTLFNYSPKRLDRLPMSLFEGVTIQAKIETVKESRGRSIPRQVQYSKVQQLIKVVG